jgi:hypothetical protein
MTNPMFPNFPAGIELRSAYELELADCIECRRRVAREHLETSENAARKVMTQAVAKVTA